MFYRVLNTSLKFLERLKAANSLSTNPTKWSNSLKRFTDECLSVFDHFVGMALKGLNGPSSNHFKTQTRCFRWPYSGIRPLFLSNKKTKEVLFCQTKVTHS